jgi:cytochrome c oxidase subunit 4
MSDHIVPRRTYYLIFAALLVLTAVTVAVAFLDVGPLNTIAAMSIASIKATLIVLYFMHARYGSRLVWVFLGCGIMWLGVLLALIMSDYVSRGWTG